jgi:hypothetical protein
MSIIIHHVDKISSLTYFCFGIWFYSIYTPSLTSQHEALGKSSLVYLECTLHPWISLIKMKEGSYIYSLWVGWSYTPIRSLQCLMIYLHFRCIIMSNLMVYHGWSCPWVWGHFKNGRLNPTPTYLDWAFNLTQDFFSHLEMTHLLKALFPLLIIIFLLFLLSLTIILPPLQPL